MRIVHVNIARHGDERSVFAAYDDDPVSSVPAIYRCEVGDDLRMTADLFLHYVDRVGHVDAVAIDVTGIGVAFHDLVRSTLAASGIKVLANRKV